MRAVDGAAHGDQQLKSRTHAQGVGIGDDRHTSAISLTPGYAAPEQYQPGPVTTATDIHALGILLGELLTGQLLPHRHARSDLARACLDAATLPTGLPGRVALSLMLRGDLDAIYNTAHAQDPARRYRSAGLLADDLERYLHNRPVTARTPSVWYRLRKSIQRNRATAPPRWRRCWRSLRSSWGCR